MAPTQITDLPVEIVIKIFEKLQSPEIFKVAEVCTNWFNISQHQAIINNAIVHITQSDAVDFFLETTRKFKFNLKFKHSLPEKFLQFSTKFTENIIEVCFIKIRLSKYCDFIENLTNLKNMRNLKIINCSFEGDGCLTAPEDLSLNLTSLLLTITSTTSMKDYEVQHLLSIIPNLKSLSCNLSEDFYLEKAIVGYLKNPKLTQSLKEIYFISFKSTALCDIFNTNHLNLTKFFWKTFNAIDNVSQLETFLVQQKDLKVLDLYLVQDFLRSAVRICTKLNLDQLSFNLNLQTFDDSEILQVFWKLKNLKVYNCNSVIFKSLTKLSDLESLTLIGYTDDMSECKEKFEFLTNLTSLRVEESFINDNLIQSIFKNLTNLKELYLLDHKLESEITDFGITGNGHGYPMSRLENLQKFDLFAKSDGITDESLRHISGLKNIKQVNIPRSKSMSECLFNSNKFDSTIYLHKNNNYLKYASSLTILFGLFN